MYKATIKFKSKCKISFSKHVIEKKQGNEDYDSFEQRIWKQKVHYDSNGYVIIPSQMFKNTLDNAAQYLSMKIPGQRNATFTKHFKSGIMINDDINLNVKDDDLKAEWLFVPADGKSGGGARVDKCFPYLDNWNGETEIYIIDNEITQDILQKHLNIAGNFIGFGRFRPKNGGNNGRFEAEITAWNKYEI